MKLLFDFFPILLFFVAYKYAEAKKVWAAAFATEHLGAIVSGGVVSATEAPVVLATVLAIVAGVGQIGWLLARGKKVEVTHWLSISILAVMGGITVWFHNETFIKWKPSVLYWAMAAAMLLTPLFKGKNALKAMMGEQLSLPDAIWQRLTWIWVAFFAAMGVLNLWVAFHFSTDVWVNFKLFGSLGLTFVFMIAQGFYLTPYLQDAAPAEASDATTPPTP